MQRNLFMSIEYATILSQFQVGDMMVEYLLATDSRAVGLRVIPASMLDKLATRGEFLETHEIRLLPGFMTPIRAWQVEPLVQVKLMGDSMHGFSQGLTMRNSEMLSSLRYAGQEIQTDSEKIEIVTTLRSERGYACDHHLCYRHGDEAITIQTVFRNEGQALLTLELLASFALSGLSPFAEDDAPNRLHLHRFRSSWSAEGRHVCQPIEELNLERSWSGQWRPRRTVWTGWPNANTGVFPVCRRGRSHRRRILGRAVGLGWFVADGKPIAVTTN
jgi:alpha-galactosidase